MQGKKRFKIIRPFYPKYICVVVRFKEQINNEKLTSFMRDYQNQNCPDNKLGRKNFHYRVADENKSFEMTGYPHNGVTPFLLGDQIKDVIVSEVISKGTGSDNWVRAFWLGGGNIDVKLSKNCLMTLGMNLDEFIEKSDCTVQLGDIAVERKGAEEM